MKKKSILFAAAILMLPSVLFADNTSRDANVDLQLNANALTGIAPPTGSQTTVPAAVSSGSQKFIDPYLPAVMRKDQVVLGQTDGKARVYEVRGKVLVSKQGSPVETALKKGATLTAGDTIVTEAKSSVSITFDESYKNAVQIPENSKAVLESIEPTNIRIENGTIFNSVDGLPQGSTWKVSTPSAIAAVRGTLYIVRYQAANGQFYAATVNVPDDGKTSAIDIQPISGDSSANVPEGKEITLQEGQVPDLSLVQDLDPSVLEEILKFFKEVSDLRGNQGDNKTAPPTSGQYDALGSLDPAGPGVVGGDENRLDVQELGTIKEDLPPVEEFHEGQQEETPPENEERDFENDNR